MWREEERPAYSQTQANLWIIFQQDLQDQCEDKACQQTTISQQQSFCKRRHGRSVIMRHLDLNLREHMVAKDVHRDLQ